MTMKRVAIPRKLQIEIYRRDGWLCHWCGRPVIFGPAMKFLERFARDSGFSGQLAYYHAHWTRRDAPLLDYMGATIDHVQAHSGGGKAETDNLVTACCKCNYRKSDAKREEFQAKLRRHHVMGKYGEPVHWDGLSTLFVILAKHAPKIAGSEREWLRWLTAH
jgi:5-methylcytosine-specific restriction endonuclease McrA